MGDIYDIMVKDLMARRQAEEEEDSDDDEEDEDEISSQSESEGEPVALDEAEREMLRRTLSMDADGEYDDDESSYPRGMEENGKDRTEPQVEGSEEEEEMPKAKEVSGVLLMKPQQYTIDRRWASATTLPSLPRDQDPVGQKQSKQQKEEGGGGSSKSGNRSNNVSPSGSGSHFLSLRNLRAKDKEAKEAKESKTSKDGHQKKCPKEEAPPSSSSSSSTSSSSSNGGKVRKRDILRGTFLSLREEKQELRGKLHEWRAHRDSEKKEKEVDRELRKRTKEEAKAAAAAKHEPSSSSSSSSSSSKRTTRKQEEEWERKDRKAAEAYAKRYGLDRSFDDRPREGTKCYTSFDDNEVEDDAPLARSPRPLLGARP